MNAAIPPWRCASAMMCRQTVVLPDPSGPKTSTTRPRGIPPTPSAMSSANDPVGMVPNPPAMGCSPSFITAPLPCCFSICWSVTSNILSRSTRSPFRSRPTPEEGRMSTPDERSSTLATGSDISYTPVIRTCTPHTRTVLEHVFGCKQRSGTRERERPEALVPRCRTPEVAPEQDDPVDRERDGFERARRERLREDQGRLAPGDGEVRREGAGLRAELGSHRLVERRRDPCEPAGVVVQARPEDTTSPGRRERPESGEPGLDGRTDPGNLLQAFVDPRAQTGPRLSEELQRDVPVLVRHPAGFRELPCPRLDRARDDAGGLGGDIERDEQTQRPRLGSARTVACHHTVRSDAGNGRPSRCRRTRSSAACCDQRITRSRAPAARKPRA